MLDSSRLSQRCAVPPGECRADLCRRIGAAINGSTRHVASFPDAFKLRRRRLDGDSRFWTFLTNFGKRDLVPKLRRPRRQDRVEESSATWPPPQTVAGTRRGPPAVCDYNNDRKPDLLVGQLERKDFILAQRQIARFRFTEEQISTAKPAANVCPKPRFPGIRLARSLSNDKPRFRVSRVESICQATRRGLVASGSGGKRGG